MKTNILLFSLLFVTNTFANNASVQSSLITTIGDSNPLGPQTKYNDSLDLKRFPNALHYNASLAADVKLKNKPSHKLTISYFKKNSDEVVFKESYRNIIIVENSVALKIGAGKAQKLKYKSLQELFANNPEVEMSWKIDETILYPKIGILPAGHSQKSGLLLKGASFDDKALHWKGFNSPSTVSSFRATLLTSDKATLVNNGAQKSNPYELNMNGPYLSIPVRDMPLANTSAHAFQEKETNTLRHEDLYDKNGFRYGTKAPKKVDLLAENSRQNPGGFLTPTTNINVPGMPNISGFYPPDIEGAVGVNYYVQMVNSTFEIYNKSDGTVAQAARDTKSLWSSHGGRCQSDNSGDAIALYDEQAGRWVLTQFAVAAAPESVCFAISVTGDPTGAYYTYDLVTARFPDYYKLGVWPAGGTTNNAYFMGTNSGQQSQYDVYAIDRENMLLGQPARAAQFFQGEPNLLMPADSDGDTPPPANAPGVLYTIRDGGEAYFGNPATDSIDIYEFDVDWITPTNTTLTRTQVITSADGLSDFNWTVCGFFVNDCLPQSGTAIKIDSGSWWPQQRLQYRNFGGFETLVGTWTVDVLAVGDHAAPRWFELRRNIGAGSWNLRQEGTLAPDADHRFSPSISMDASENIGIGYSVTSSSLFPSIRYAVHDASVDPLGTMEPEASMVAGGGSQTGTANRWGDYASMDVDPVDDCTFWFTSEYYTSTSGAGWVTRIGAFKVPTCKNYLITAVSDSIQICQADDTASFSLSLSNSFDATTNMTLSSCPAGANCSFSPNPVVNPTSTTALNLTNLTAAASGSHLMTATATDSVDSLATNDIGLSLYLFNGNPGTPVLASPTNSSFVASLGPDLTWSAVTDGQDSLVEIDDDPAFGSVNFTTTIIDGLTTTASSGLSENTCYYWRVSPSNLCGSGTTSSVFSFYTGAAQTTADFASTDVPLTIDTVPVSVPSTLTISGVGVINDVNVVGIAITHSYVGDLTLTLESPSGTVVTIMNVGCGTDNNIDLSLDDEAGGTWGCTGGGPVGGGGTFQPSNALTAFDGENANGVWTLTVIDGFNQDGGSLNGWGLNFENFANTGDYCNAVSTYTIGGTVSGLTGSGLVLQNNTGDDLAIAADGSFTFVTALADLSTYSVTVLTGPSTPSQTCSVTNASGTLAGANVTDVSVTCSTNSFTVGGTVTGLTGSGLVLQNNAGDNLAIAADGSFTFVTALTDLSPYVVTVLTQPSSPNQTCSVTNASGTLAGSNVTNVSISCGAVTYTVGGNVSGLTGSGLVLQNNLGDNLPVAADGGFTFVTPLADLAAYSVTVLTQPSSPTQLCTVTNGAGNIAGANVSNVTVSCALIPDILFAGVNLIQDVCIDPGPTAITPVTLTTTALNGYNNTIALAFNPVLPTGISGGFSNNSFVPVAAPGTDSLLNLTVDNTATAGLNTITVEASGPGITTKSVNVDLNVIFALTSPVVTSPADGSTSVLTSTSFNWSVVSGAISYDIDISTDPTFAVVLDTANVGTNSYTPGASLNSDTVYYWRVRANNTCGSTVYTISAFETAAASGSTTTTYCSDPNLNVSIPDNSASGVDNTFSIAASGTITDVNITLNVSHTQVGDLIFNVQNDTLAINTTIIDRIGYLTGGGSGCKRDNINTKLDSASTTAVEGVCPNTNPTIGAGPFSPNNTLNVFNGQSITTGNWTLNSSDNKSVETGTLNQWCVEITVSNAVSTPADYSDLNSSYGVAKHEGGGTSKLGNNWTANASFVEGADSPVIEGGSGDDDGIVASGTWTVGSPTAVIDATVNTAGYLSCWFDWDDSGDFDAGEEGIGTLVSAGTNSLSVTVPVTSFGSTGDGFLETRCRFYDSLQARAPASPLGTALSGEVEDYKLPADQLTPVTLAYTKSIRSNSGFSLNWSTTTESGTIGFNVFGLENNTWRKLNSQPISAKGINSVSPHDYQINSGFNQIDTYKIEELIANGKTQVYGPYASNLTYGKYPITKKINWQSIAQESNLKSNIRQNSLQSGFDFIKISVNQTGIQRITYEDLIALGVNWQGVAADDISLAFENNPVARKVSGDVFGPGSYIDFIGTAANTLYTKTNIYILKLDASLANKEIAVTDTTFNIDTSAYYMATSKRDEDAVYSFASPTSSPWFLRSMLAYTTTKVWSYPINTPYLLDNNISSKLNVEAWGGTDWPQVGDHHLQVLLDNQLISDVISDGTELIKASVFLNHSQVTGVSNITFKLPADTGVDYDLIQLDGFSLDYPSEIFAINDKLSFVPVVNSSINADVIFSNSFENNFTNDGFLVQGLTTQDNTVYAFDGTNLYDFPGIQIISATAGYELKVPMLSKSDIKYFINNNSNIINPQISLSNNSAINLSQQYDYLMISHPDFTDTLNQLVSYHQSKGLNVLVVDVEDIYAQYSFGRIDANSIKTFIKDAASQTGIQTVLLVGSDTSDYLDNLSIGSKSFIPTLYYPTDSLVKYAPVDTLFVDTNNDLTPDLSIGRLPVRTNLELQNIINKIMLYANRSYIDTAVFSTDRSLSFDAFSNQMVNLMPSNWQINKAYINTLDINAAQSTIINSIENGVSLASYFGHSGPNTWSFEHLFDNSDILSLNNLNKPTLINQFGCWNTYYVMPEFDTMAHHFMSLENKGAVAVLGASTLTQSSHESILGNLLIPKMAQSNVPTGLAILQAKQALANSHPDYLDVLLGWTLLGDPMTVLNQQ